MQFCPTQVDGGACYSGDGRVIGWGYEDAESSHYPSPYSGPLFPPSQPPMTHIPASLPTFQGPTGLKPNLLSPTRHTFSPLTRPLSSFPLPPSPPRACSPVFSVPPSLISESSSTTLSPALSYYQDFDYAYPSPAPSLSLVGNSLAGFGCDSPMSDSLDYEVPLAISGRSQTCPVFEASARLQAALTGGGGGRSASVVNVQPQAPPRTAYPSPALASPAPVRESRRKAPAMNFVPFPALRTIEEDVAMEAPKPAAASSPPRPERVSSHPATPAYTPTAPSTPPPPYSAPSASGTPIEVSGGSSFFGAFEHHCGLVDASGNSHDLFPTLSPPAFEFDPTSREWICYRRNYISLSVSVSLPSHPLPGHLFTSPSTSGTAAHSSPITHLSVSIDTRSLPSDKRVVVLQFDPSRKLRLARDVEDQLVPVSLPAASPPRTPRRASAAFTRLQYRSATANNGKQSHTQERYVAVVRLDAVRDDGTRGEVGRWTSRAFIVRGRSPKNFTSARREGGGSGTRRGVSASGGGEGVKKGAGKRKWGGEEESEAEESGEEYRPEVWGGAEGEEWGCERKKRVRRSAEEAIARLRLDVVGSGSDDDDAVGENDEDAEYSDA